MNLKDLFPAFEAAYQAMTAIYEPVFLEYSNRFKLTSQDLSLLMTVPTFEPTPVSVALLSISSPYTAPELYLFQLDNLVDAGMLNQVGENEYRMSEQGLDALKIILNAINATLGGIQTLPVTKMMDLASRLKELADTCLTASDPPGTWCIQHKRRMDPGSGSPMMARIFQFLAELRAFRDDAHLASWHGIESDGHAWDILTYLWIEKESSFESICRALKRRGNLPERTQQAVDMLAQKGWLTKEDSILRITSTGSEIRRTAEAITDRYYLEPFRRFPEIELERTLVLIEEHRRGLPI